MKIRLFVIITTCLLGCWMAAAWVTPQDEAKQQGPQVEQADAVEKGTPAIPISIIAK